MACSQYLGNASFFTITPQDGYFWITELLLVAFTISNCSASP